MGLIGKVMVGKAAADFAGKEARRVEKKVKKKIKRTKKTILLLLLSFCAGAVCMGTVVYTHRQAIAAAVSGKSLPKGEHSCCCAKSLLSKLKK